MKCRVERVCRAIALFAVVPWMISGCGDDGLPAFAPGLQSLTITTDEDQMVTFDALMAIEGDHEGLRVEGPAAPDGHTAVVANGNPQRIQVRPKPDFNGSFNVTYFVVSGGDRIAARATILVAPVNDAPVAIAAERKIQNRSAIELEARDVDGDTLRYELVGKPQHGEIVGTGRTVEYVPELGYFGADAFSFRVSDGVLTSAPAELSLEVSIGANPVAFPAALTVDEDHELAVVLRGVDEQVATLIFRVSKQPQHGRLSGTAPDLTYTPDENYHGPDVIEFFVDDGEFTSSVAAVNLTIEPVNDLPVGDAQTVNVTEDEDGAITLTASDVETTALTFEAPSEPAHGQLQGSGTSWTYTPEPNFHGTDHFTFRVSDGDARSEPTTVTIEVAPVDDLPAATALLRTIDEDSEVELTLSGGDIDTAGEVTLDVTAQPQHGRLVGDPPAVTYIPEPNFHGTDRFTYTASVGDVTSFPALVEIEVLSINDPPVVTDIVVSTDEDTPVEIALPGSDVDEGDELSFSVDTSTGSGTWSSDGQHRTYAPALNENGRRTFTFTVSDQSVAVTGTVTIEIAAINDAPVAVDDFVMTEPATPILVDVIDNDSDVDSPFALTVVVPPARGTATIDEETGRLLYTPPDDLIGTELITYTITDAEGATAMAVAHIGVGEFPPGAPAERLVALDDGITATVSHDGRYIAFATQRPLVEGDHNDKPDVYLLDRATRQLTRVSRGIDGVDSNGYSAQPKITPDGRFIVFDSFASNLVSGDTNEQHDVFRFERRTNAIVRVSVSTGGTQGSNASLIADVSDDGNLVAFHSYAPDLVDNDVNGRADVFVRDIALGTTSRISVGPTGEGGNGDSGEPAISGDGRFVAFSSSATNLVPDDTNRFSDVFLFDRQDGTMERVSVTAGGEQADKLSSFPTISREGSSVLFVTSAALVPGEPDGGVFLRELREETSTTVRVADATDVMWAQLSADGRYALTSSHVVTVIEIATGQSRVLISGGFSPILSGNSRYVVWLTADGLYAGPNPL